MAGSLWAARRWFKGNPGVAGKMQEVLRDIYSEFGLKSRIVAPLVGRYLLMRIRREDKRLRAGRTYEPPTYYDLNDRAARLARRAGRKAHGVKSVAVGEAAAVAGVFDRLVKTVGPLAVTRDETDQAKQDGRQ